MKLNRLSYLNLECFNLVSNFQYIEIYGALIQSNFFSNWQVWNAHVNAISPLQKLFAGKNTFLMASSEPEYFHGGLRKLRQNDQVKIQNQPRKNHPSLDIPSLSSKVGTTSCLLKTSCFYQSDNLKILTTFLASIKSFCWLIFNEGGWDTLSKVRTDILWVR